MSDDFDTFKEIKSLEERFDRAQAELRRAASFWVLAVFGGLGFSGSGPANIAHNVVAALIPCIGVGGLFLLWLVDQGIYQRLFHSAFTYGLYLEQKNSDLPLVRSVMYSRAGNISKKLSLFYFGPMVAFIAISVVIWGFDPHPWSFRDRCLIIPALALSLLLLGYGWHSFRKNDIASHHVIMYGDRFETYFEKLRAMVRISDLDSLRDKSPSSGAGPNQVGTP